MDAIIPIVGVIIGGVLATLGSLAMYRVTRRGERGELLREKLQELYGSTGFMG